MRKAIVEIPDEHGAACIYYLTESGEFKMVPSAEIIDASVAGAEPVAHLAKLRGPGAANCRASQYYTCFENDKGAFPVYAAPAPAQGAVPEGLAELSMQLVVALENKDDLPPTKWALKCGYICNKVRALIETSTQEARR